MQHKFICLSVGALLFGCSTGSNSRVAVEANDLGVTSIETDHYIDNSGDVFELVGLGSADQTIASVRVRIGTVEGLLGNAPDDDHHGSEITVTIAGKETRTVTRETTLIRLYGDAQTQTLLAIPTVAAVLNRDAHVIPGESATAKSEVAYSGQACPPSDLVSSPTAYECCYSGTDTYFGAASENTKAPTQQLIIRHQNPHLTGCKASDGLTNCSGNKCYFGPLGFAHANVMNGTSNYYLIIQTNTNGCSPSWSGFNPGQMSPDAHGNGGTDCHCCGNSTGPCCGTACNACGGGSGYWQ